MVTAKSRIVQKTDGDEPVSSAINEDLQEAREETAGKTPMYLPYDPAAFSLLHLYRPQNDVIASLIYKSGMEGVDRYEMSKSLGINAKTKAGNRTISNSIQCVLKELPTHFGTFQKMEGKHRFIKYYAKNNEQLFAGGTALIEFYDRFKKLTNVDCPYKLGDTIKFPQQNLSTLRISDVTLKRLVRMLEYLYTEKVVVTRSKFELHISALEREEGYAYQVDRKSIKKCLIALSKKRFLNIMKMEVIERKVPTLIDIITIPEIHSIDHPFVCASIQKAEMEFKEQNKSFPSGVRLKQEPKDSKGAQLAKETGEDETLSDRSATSGTKKMKQEPTGQEDDTSEKRSLLSKTFNTIQRLSLKKYSRKAGGTPLAVLSQKSLNTLVEVAKKRRLSKPIKGGIKKRRIVKEEDMDNDEDEQDHDESVAIVKPKSRQLKGRIQDTLDLQSLQHKAYLRSRFTQRERDMLLFIRACSFFLNPATRFWPHPRVIRTLMHEYVPESRTKTTYSLMAAGVREIKSKERYAHHQYIVKTMASYRELIDLRNQLAQMNLNSASGDNDELRPKDYFFMDVFRTSYQLMFRESSDFPSVCVADTELRSYLRNNDLYFIALSDGSRLRNVLRTKQPLDANEIRHCIAYNIVMSVLLSSWDPKNDNELRDKTLSEENSDRIDGHKLDSDVSPEEESDVSNFVIGQIGIKTLAEVVEKLRIDGLITKKRIFDGNPQTLDGQEKDKEKETPTMRGEIVETLIDEEKNSQRTFGVEDSLELDGQLPSTSWAVEGETNQAKIGVGGAWRSQLKCTHIYKHYFQTDYHKNLYGSILHESSLSLNGVEANDYGGHENPGQLLTLADSLCQDIYKFSLEISMPSSIKELFFTKKSEDCEMGSDSAMQNEFDLTTNATKQLRYLENTDLRLELLQIRLGKNNSVSALLHSLPDPLQLISVQIIPENKMPSSSELENDNKIEINKNSSRKKRRRKEEIDALIESMDSDSCRKLFELIERHESLGITEEHLETKMLEQGFDLEVVLRDLNSLISSADVIICGIDKRRYVSTRKGGPWLIHNKSGQGYVPKPWIYPSGQINWCILRWMLEGLFSYVFAHSGISLDDLFSHFLFVLQPSLTFELIQILEKLGCCKIQEKMLTALNKATPFLRVGEVQKVNFITASTGGMERIILFSEFKLNSYL